ncbi:MAG: GNAT family N-acetyltransferase [Ruminococcaceae bacterium]|nr:GNAT family N-acetyltransferase [Oscillospiraceae bacterium]
MITLAKDGMRTDLERIWRLCFNDPPEYVKYFFDFRYNPNSCVVYVDESIGRPVAMLHLLDASLTEDSEIVPIQYIYAAATRPDYQGRGIMRQLLEFARQYTLYRRQKYIVLLPGSKELYKFYEDKGYHRCFRIRKVFMTRQELTSLAGQPKEDTDSLYREKNAATRLNLSDIHAIRRDVLADREGFVTWDFPAVRYAADVHRQFGGTIITSTNGYEAGYAFCRPEENDTLLVSELITVGSCQRDFVRLILDSTTQQNFEFHVPVYDELFAPFGEVCDYGMICAVNQRKPINLLTLTGSHQPYLGLALD